MMDNGKLSLLEVMVHNKCIFQMMTNHIMHWGWIEIKRIEETAENLCANAALENLRFVSEPTAAAIGIFTS